MRCWNFLRKEGGIGGESLFILVISIIIIAVWQWVQYLVSDWLQLYIHCLCFQAHILQLLYNMYTMNFSAKIHACISSIPVNMYFLDSVYSKKNINMNRSKVPWMLLGHRADWVSGGDYSASMPSKCHRHPCWSGQAVNPGLPKDDQRHLSSWWIFW